MRLLRYTVDVLCGRCEEHRRRDAEPMVASETRYTNEKMTIPNGLCVSRSLIKINDPS